MMVTDIWIGRRRGPLFKAVFEATTQETKLRRKKRRMKMKTVYSTKNISKLVLGELMRITLV